MSPPLTNSKRRPHPLAVDDRRSCVPPVAARYGVKTRQAIAARRQDQRAGYVRRRFQQRQSFQLVRSTKARIRFLLSQSIALFYVHRPPDCEPIDWRVLMDHFPVTLNSRCPTLLPE